MNAIDCKACSSGQTEVFYEQLDVPTNSCILLATEHEAVSYPRGDIVLTFCHDCGFMFNQAFDPKLTEYSGRYEETQSYSETFNKFHYELADRLIEEHALEGKRILEIGCGKGEFLAMLCERAKAKGVGFDPGYQDGRLDLSGLDIEFVKDFYSEKYTEQSADFVCCKMTLEHIPEAKAFMNVVRDTIAEDSADVFFQIPESERILSMVSFEDVYYEHCNYFTQHSLAVLFQNSRFDVQSVSTEYDDQYLTIEALTGRESKKFKTDPGAVAHLWGLAKTYKDRVDEEITGWRKLVDEASAAGKNVVIWGSGSKGVSLLSSLDRDQSINAVVDINPNRWGYFMCGSGHPIVSPDELVKIDPDLVIVMNRIYVDEISEMLSERGIQSDIRALGS